MGSIQSFIIEHANHAHWYFFGAVLLAGFNVPISIDIVMLLGALLAATIIPENMWIIFISLSVGCYLSAWIAYWMGRLLGRALLHFKFFNKLLPPERLQRTKVFYEKYGLWTLLIGRFIPFGVRNCLFMTTGMSKLSFRSFVLRDALACSIWSTTAFFTFYSLGQNYKVLYYYLKTFNILIFSLFGVAVIGFVWYKRRKNMQSKIAKDTS